MRKDYRHVILETGRHKYESPQRIKDGDMDAQQCPMRNQRERFDFDDRTRPLRRFLQKQVGRPWNKVYSELCEQSDARNIRGFHLRSHIYDWVVKNCDVKKTDKGWRQRNVYSNGGWSLFSQGQLFIDDHGIIRKPRSHETYPSRKQRYKTFENNFRYITDHSAYIKIDNIWWYFEWKSTIDFEANEHLTFKNVLVKLWGDSEYYLSRRSLGSIVDQHGNPLKFSEKYIHENTFRGWGHILYFTVKRQLNKKEIKRLK